MVLISSLPSKASIVFAESRGPAELFNIRSRNHAWYFLKKLFVAFPWVETSTGPGGFMICVFII